MPVIAAASATAAAAALQSSGPSQEPLPQQQLGTEALAKVKHQKSADKEVLKLKDKKCAEKQVFKHHSKNQELTMDNLDDIIRRLIDVQSSPPGKQVDLSETEIRHLCATSRDIFLSQPNLLELESPVKVCGDIHGKYSELLRLFEYGGFPPNANYLFLGNYFGYGKHGLETMCLLLAYKIKYPENFFLLRGERELASINRIYGFYDECKRRFSKRVGKAFADCFSCLPVAALVYGKILCIHGGLSPDLTNLDQIRSIPRHRDVPDHLVLDLLQPDPDGRLKVAEDGYEFFADRQFSAPNRRGVVDRAGAMVNINENSAFQILKSVEKKPRFLSPRRRGDGSQYWVA